MLTTGLKDGEFSREQFWQVHSKLIGWMQAPVEFAYRIGWRANEVLGLQLVANPVRPEGDQATVSLREERQGPAGRFERQGARAAQTSARVGAKDVEWVFPDEDGRSRITYDRAVDRFQGACSQVQLPKGQFTDADGKPRQPAFHDLRHTFAREALRSGMSESDVMQIAGWKTPVMLRRYLGSNEEGQRQALAAADKVFG